MLVVVGLVYVFACRYVYYCLCFKQKTAYVLRISDWSSDVCSSDLFSFPSEDNGGVGASSARLCICTAHVLRGIACSRLIGRRNRSSCAGAEIGSASCRERVCQDV